MREILNAIRNVFFTEIIGNVDLYTIISTIIKFVFVFIVLYFIYLIVKIIIFDIKNINFEQVQKKAYLTVYNAQGNSKKYLLENVTTIGRNMANDIVLNNDLVSGFHAEIVKSENTYFILDKDSLNGTFLNDEEFNGNIELFDGDKIQIATYELIFTEEIDPKPEV